MARNLEYEHLSDKEVAKTEGIEVAPLDGMIATKDDEKELYIPPEDIEHADGAKAKPRRRRICGIPVRVVIWILVLLILEASSAAQSAVSQVKNRSQ